MGASRRASLALGGAILTVAWLLRIANAGTAFQDGVPIVAPLDDLYQAKRILHSARHFPSVLDFDPDRGVAGAFCPWPPLYPLAVGGLARLLGGRTTNEILTRAAWIPPVLSSLVAGLLAAVLARRLGVLAGVAGGVAVAVSIPLVRASGIGAIDHHFLEAALLLGVFGATLRIVGEGRRPRPLLDGLLLGLALVAALFVQTALLLSAALSFVVLYAVRGDEAALRSGAVGFGVAAAAVALHQLGKPAGSPTEVWYLGVPHLAALVAGAIAFGLRLRLRVSFGERAAAGLAIVAGAGVALWLPDIPWTWISGSSFFGGDPWLSTIVEFQPLFQAEAGPVSANLLRVGGAVLLVPPFLLLCVARPSRVRTAAGLFAATYLAAAVTSQRFLVPAVPLFAVAAAFVVSDEAASGRRFLAWAAVSVVVLPALLCHPVLIPPAPTIPTVSLPALRAASWLKQRRGDAGRVLGPWSWGHVFDVVGERPVLIDNFGAMLGRVPFDSAIAATLLPGEERLAAFCRRTGVRFLVLDSPFRLMAPAVGTAGLPPALFVRPGPTAESPSRFSRLAQASFWWRAYYDLGRARPEAGRWGRPFRSFRLVWTDRESSGDPAPFSGPALQIWEFVPGAAPGTAPGRP